ncbi:MAG TPA: hypothetical protein EYP10_06740, partial [Armatimonadetes bacterium]|nr:hypothetical protein [Armatimonadota bacterium]
MLFHVSLLPLRGFGAYSKPTPLKEYTLRVEIEQPEREEERKVEPPKPTPQPQPQHRPRPVKSPQVAARKAGKPTVVRQMPQRVQPKQPEQQMKAVPSKRKVVTVRTPHTQIAMRLHKDARATERPRVKPAVVPPATFKTDREVTAPTLRKRQRIAKALPKFGERLVTERREIIPAQAERPSAQRTTSPIVEIARSVRKPRARPQATLSSPQTLPTVAGVGAQRRPGLTAPAPQEAEVARLPDAPTGRRGAMRPKRRPQPSQAPIAAAFLPEGRGGAKRRGAFESGGGSGAHAPQRLQIGRPIGRGVGFSRPRPNAYGSDRKS